MEIDKITTINEIMGLVKRCGIKWPDFIRFLHSEAGVKNLLDLDSEKLQRLKLKIQENHGNPSVG